MPDNIIIFDEKQTPGEIHFSEKFNVAVPFIDRHLDEQRGNKTAISGEFGEISYYELVERVNRSGNALKKLGLSAGDRVLMVVKDCPEFFYIFWEILNY